MSNHVQIQRRVLCASFFLLALLSFTIIPPAEGAPVANFTGTPTSGTLPFTVTFTDSSTGGPTGWAWFFGDENYTAPWTLVNAGAGWSIRAYQTIVAMPDGSIVLMGGKAAVGGRQNDVWRSTDNGATWTKVNATPGWLARAYQSSVALQDGSLVLMGGGDTTPIFRNDTWRSTDDGTTWTNITSGGGWSARYGQSSVAMPDGSIVLTGGLDSSGPKNDVWRSINDGASWTPVNASAAWPARYEHSSVAMPDGSIVLMGGEDYISSYNDTWRSTDEGVTWTKINGSSGWAARFYHSSVAMPDGSILLTGGYTGVIQKNDTWRSTDNGAHWTLVNPSPGWPIREGHSCVVMPNGSILLMGGLGPRCWFLL